MALEYIFYPSIAQLVERRTVGEIAVILRSLVQIRLEVLYFFLVAYANFLTAVYHDMCSTKKYLSLREEIFTC